MVRHAELLALTVAHVDCDAFYASVEKRDRPELASRPVVVDNTNVTIEERARLIAVARRHGARVVGYFFDCEMADCLARNQTRTGKARVPRAGRWAKEPSARW